MPLSVLARRALVTSGALRLFLVKIAQNLLDAILMRHRLVEPEIDLRNAPQAQPAADVASQERRRTGEGGGGIAPRRGITHHGVEHARQLQIRRHLDARQRDEADAGIVDDTSSEEIAQLLTNLIA